MNLSKYLFILPLIMQPIFSEDWPGFGGVSGNFISSENNIKKIIHLGLRILMMFQRLVRT